MGGPAAPSVCTGRHPLGASVRGAEARA